MHPRTRTRLGAWALAATTAACAALAGCGGPSEKELTASAQSYLDKGDAKSAIIELKTALQKHADNPRLRFMLGSALLASGDAVGAAVELDKARDLHYEIDKVAPPLAQALLAQGQPRKVVEQFGDVQLVDRQADAELRTRVATAYAALGDKAAAREAIAAAQKSVPGHAPALLVQARLDAGEGNVDGALATVAQLLARDAKNEGARLLQADLLAAAKNDPEGAVAAWRQALADRPDLLAAHLGIISTRLKQGRFDEAKAQLEALRKVHPNNVQTRFYDAELAYRQGDYAAVRAITDPILKATPDNALVLQLAGAAEYRLRSMQAAENHLSRALQLQPNLGLARVLLAQIYVRGGQPDKAVDLLKPVVAQPDADPRLLALAAEAALQAGDAKGSDQLFARAAKSESPDPKLRAALAMHEIEKGNDKGFAELESVASADASARADLALVSARLQRNDLAGALKAIDALQKKQPDKPVAYQLRGRVLALQRDSAGAAAAFEKALALDPLYFPAASSLAALDLQANHPDQARQRFDAMLRVDPKNYRALLALADLKARAGGSKDEVVQAIAQAIKLNPNEPAPRVLLANFLLGRGDAKGALTAAQEASAALPNDFDVMDALGRAQLAAGAKQQAVSTFTRLAALQPTRPLPQLRLGDAYLAARDAENAKAAFQRALKITPDLPGAQRALAKIAIGQGQPATALEIARTLQKQHPSEALGWLLEGDAEASRKNWAPAIAAYRGALQKDKDKGSEAAARLHGALVLAGRQTEADQQAAHWLATHPKDPAFLFHLGDVLMTRGDWAGAEARYREVAELQPENALAWNNVAWLLVKQGKAGGVAMAEKANALLPGSVPLMDTLALALLADNQLPRALELQKKAVQTAPDDPTLRLTLARIYLKSGDKPAAKTELDKLARLGAGFPAQGEVAELMKLI